MTIPELWNSQTEKYMLSTIESMTDIECKKWLMFSRNRAWLRNYWVTNFPEIAPKNSGEILYY